MATDAILPEQTVPADAEALHPANQQQALEWLLVLAAMATPHQLGRHGDAWTISVARADAPFARAQLDAYERENCGWPPPEPVLPPAVQRSGWSAVWVAAMLVSLYAWFGPYHAGHAALNSAACDSRRVLAGEWWRIVSAMGVHADLGHLGANLVAVLAFGWPAATSFGGGVAWLGALVAAAAANAAGAWLPDTPRISLGASTGTFALLGMLAGRRLGMALGAGRRKGGNRPALAPWRVEWLRSGILLPVGVGLAAFVVLGMSPESDLTGHFLGLAGGMLLGSAAHALGLERLPEICQRF
ncbi:MAG: rhomboid family intramembrane serine protease, partial [Kiritimatiellae bacterium]|nr:rhomboid family intramembrane serine protease [Kiritimatiellia bacterium]